MALASKKRKAEQNGSSSSSDDGDAEADIPKLIPADVRCILNPLSKDQLLDVLQDAACRHVDVLDEVRALTDANTSTRKLFVRGLSWDTTSSGLRAAFSAYGDLQKALVIIDKLTLKSKGYGFVIFRHVDGALLALKEPSKLIDGRMTVTELASTGFDCGPSSSTVPPAWQRKIYVTGVPDYMPAERLLQHFMQYGEIEEGSIGYDKLTADSKGYVLFLYKTPEGANAAVAERVKKIDGHILICNLAKGERGNRECGLPVTSFGAGMVAGDGSIPGSSDLLGRLSSFTDIGAGSHYTPSSNLPSSSAGSHYSLSSNLPSSGAGSHYSLSLNLPSSGAGSHYSLSSNLPSSGAGSHYSLSSNLPSSGAGSHYSLSSNLPSSGAGSHYCLSSDLPSSLGVRSSGLMDARFDLPPSPGRGAGFGGGYSSSSQFAGTGRGGGLGAGGYDGLSYGGSAHYQLCSSGITSGGDYGYSSSTLRGQHQHPPHSPSDYSIHPWGSTHQRAMPPYY